MKSPAYLPLAILLVLFGAGLVWAVCGDTAQADSYQYTPANQDPGQTYSFTRYFTIWWTDGYTRSGVYLQSSGQWNGATPPTACNPKYDFGWDVNTNGFGSWSVNAQEARANVSPSNSCYYTGNTSRQIARHYCNGCGEDERPFGDGIVAEIGDNCEEETTPTPTPTPTPSPTPDCRDEDEDGYTKCYANCGDGACDGDCDDTIAAINPGATELCEMPCVDSNCIDDEESVCQAEHGMGPQCDGVWRWCGWGTTGCCADGGNWLAIFSDNRRCKR